MKIKTHQYIAETAIIFIENMTGMSFNHRLVKIGSCAPDFAIHRRLKLHSPELAGNEFDKILGKFEGGKRSNAFLSYMLGVYSHYIADAFCFAHNYYVADLKKHMQYEIFLQELISSKPLDADIVGRVMEKTKLLKHKTALEYIKNENNQYFKTVKTMTSWKEIAETDLLFAITNCVILMTQFVYEVEEQRILAPAI